MDLKELKMIMKPQNFDNFFKLYETKTEIYTPEWFEIEERKEEILKKYGLEDLYGFRASDDDDDEDHDDYYY